MRHIHVRVRRRSYISYADSGNRKLLDLKWSQLSRCFLFFIDPLTIFFRILSSAPVDIARLILEYAAQGDRATATSICLVSKELNAWITPILYRTVKFRRHKHTERAEKGYPSLIHTRILVTWTPNKSWIMNSTLSWFPTRISCSNPVSPSANPILWKHCSGVHGYTVFRQLNRLIVRGGTWLRQGEFVYLPLYTSLTHLAFIHDIPRSFPKNAAKALPCLTHFACSYRVVSASVSRCCARFLLIYLESSESWNWCYQCLPMSQIT